jgi:hypothetical protein
VPLDLELHRVSVEVCPETGGPWGLKGASRSPLGARLLTRPVFGTHLKLPPFRQRPFKSQEVIILKIHVFSVNPAPDRLEMVFRQNLGLAGRFDISGSAKTPSFWGRSERISFPEEVRPRSGLRKP